MQEGEKYSKSLHARETGVKHWPAGPLGSKTNLLIGVR